VPVSVSLSPALLTQVVPPPDSPPGVYVLTADSFPQVTPSNIFVITTDMRMQKSSHLSHNPAMEIAWWLDPAGVQFRISGKAFPLPNQSTPEGSTRVEDALRQLRTQGEDSDPSWWEKERKRVWKEGMSGHLRASFARPPPGKPLDEVPEPDTWPTRLDAESVCPCLCVSSLADHSACHGASAFRPLKNIRWYLTPRRMTQTRRNRSKSLSKTLRSWLYR
jgi:pyridoxamine 5'-phosphate oxidase